ncbi:MAG: RNA-binding protein [Nanoarchaeota archaeon]|nr:RNA-binding protein [Nanoarchaeota archaeon]
MKIYVGNLPFSVDENRLKELFSGYNPEEVSLIQDKYSGRSKGFGFVTIADDEAAKKAISEMHEKEVEGRKLTVNEAKPKEDRPRRSFDGNRSGGRNFGGRNDNRRRY